MISREATMKRTGASKVEAQNKVPLRFKVGWFGCMIKTSYPRALISKDQAPHKKADV